jgi:hypothetical protein
MRFTSLPEFVRTAGSPFCSCPWVLSFTQSTHSWAFPLPSVPPESFTPQADHRQNSSLSCWCDFFAVRAHPLWVWVPTGSSGLVKPAPLRISAIDSTGFGAAWSLIIVFLRFTSGIGFSCKAARSRWMELANFSLASLFTCRCMVEAATLSGFSWTCLITCFTFILTLKKSLFNLSLNLPSFYSIPPYRLIIISQKAFSA